ncbi:MAG: hypothetical protein LAT78_05785 [Roseinatronobacter sp.]|nr:hypothetical protein [Roseinatronobacter sp.]
MVKVAATRKTVRTDEGIISNPYENWTIGEILRYLGPSSGFRTQFRESSYLDEVTLGHLLSSPFALNDFMANCRKLPHCGEATITRLRAVIEHAAQAEAVLKGACSPKDYANLTEAVNGKNGFRVRFER